MSDTILNTLLAAGFLPNYDKSIFTPVQSIDWLGFSWNLKDGVLEVPLKKMIKMRDKLVLFYRKSRPLPEFWRV